MITLLIILLLLVISASFSSFETALFSLSPVERQRLKTAGGGLSAPIPKILEKPRELLTTVLFGNELVNVAISILAGGLAYDLLEGHDPRLVYLLAITVTTFFLLVFGEIVPKNVAVRNSLMVSQLLVLPFRLFSWLVAPFRLVLVRLADRLVKLFGADPRRGRMIVDEELKTLLELGRREGTLEDLERTLIQNALDFSGVRVAEIMTPREKIVAIPQNLTLPQVLDFLYDHRFSRLPVFRRDLDDVVGVLLAKELTALRLSRSQTVPFDKILKPFAEIHPDQDLAEAFREFQKKRIHMGIVRDMGTTLGLVTMDDLLRRFFP